MQTPQTLNRIHIWRMTESPSSASAKWASRSDFISGVGAKDLSHRLLSSGTEIKILFEAAALPGPAPLVFFIPCSGPNGGMKDLNGNGIGYPVQNSLRSLSQAVGARGFTTFRFVPSSGKSLTPTELLEIYSIAVHHPGVDSSRVIVVGFLDGADFFAKSYYDFFAINPIEAAVLASPRASALYLNNLTCPYLVLHGSRDSLFLDTPHERVLEAIYHHQMRYGDETKALFLRGLPRELGEGTLDPRVVDEVVDWVEPFFRPRARPVEKFESAA